MSKEYVRKITCKLITELSEESAVFGGTVKSSTVVDSPYGASIKYKGEFYLRVGSIDYIANSAFLPPVADAMVSDAMSQAGDNNEVDVLFKIVKKEAKNPIGYEWSIELLYKGDVESRLDKMLKMAKVEDIL